MIRVALLWLYVLVFGFYAWRDWYISLCGLILLIAVVQHPDMPKSISGIQGANPWNVLFFLVCCGWFVGRGKENLRWDMPTLPTFLLVSYATIIAIATIRLIFDSENFTKFNPDLSIMGEFVINTFKWPIVGLLLFEGCRSRSRFLMGIGCVLTVYFLIGLQVIRCMPWNAILDGAELEKRSIKFLANQVGYHRVNLSMMLAGAFWALWAARSLVQGVTLSRLLLVSCAIMFYAQALTAGRMGYVTWILVGACLSVIRWRRYLLIAPLVVPLFIFMLATFAPGVTERLLQGFTKESVDGGRPVDRHGRVLSASKQGPDMYTVTAGRTLAWPYVIEKIQESPVVGHGRQAMIRTGISGYLRSVYAEGFEHPHNAYLEILLDNGIVGFLIVLPFYFVILKYGISLFRDSRSPIFIVSGGVASALVLALLFASFGSQTFYPREGSVGMWCAIGLMLRVYVERERTLAALRYSHVTTVSPPQEERSIKPQQLTRRRPGVLLRSQQMPAQTQTTDTVDGQLWAQAA